jgi:hypothetical protein
VVGMVSRYYYKRILVKNILLEEATVYLLLGILAAVYSISS